MTIDEALERINTAIRSDDAVRATLTRVTLTALVSAAKERGRAEGVAQCVEWLHGEAAMAAVPACRDAYESAAEHMCEVDEHGEGSALARLLAAHGREAAAAERERLRREVEPVHEAIQCAMCLVLPTPPIAGDRSMAYETLENADSMLAAALRGKEGTDAG